MASGICFQSLLSTMRASSLAGIGVDVAGTSSSSGPGLNLWGSFARVRFPVQKAPQGGKSYRGVVRCGASQPRVNFASVTKTDCSVFNGALACTNETALASTSLSSSDQSAGYQSRPLEQWLESYLTEIVRHLPEAPFVQLVPRYESLFGERQRVSEELFERPESWESVNHCLLKSAPEGIILVHKLSQESLSDSYCWNESHGTGESCRDRSSRSSPAPGGSSTDVWGLLVHGCKTRCSACYILKTTQVASSAGILTHFCLLRANCFGPSFDSQLQSAWLL